MTFNARNKCLTSELLRQGHRYHKLRKFFFPSSIADTMNWFKDGHVANDAGCFEFSKRTFSAKNVVSRDFWGLNFSVME